MASIAAIVPSYNSAATLPDALASVFQQTLAASEVIVVDDGSTDATAAAIAPWKDRIRYIRQEHRGAAAARNAAVALTSAELIAFLDADDLWLPQKLERMSAFMASHPDVDLAASDFTIQHESGSVVPSFFAAQSIGPDAHTFQAIASRCFICTPATVVRRQTWLRTGGFDESLLRREDQNLWLRIAQSGTVAFVPEVLTIVRRKQNGAPLRLALTEGVRALEAVLRSCPDLTAAEQHTVLQEISGMHYELGRDFAQAHDFRPAHEHLRRALRCAGPHLARRILAFGACAFAEVFSRPQSKSA